MSYMCTLRNKQDCLLLKTHYSINNKNRKLCLQITLRRLNYALPNNNKKYLVFLKDIS